MVDFNDFLVQVAQPYFFYSTVFLCLAFVSVALILKFSPSVSRRNQSLIWLIPLLVPVVVLLCFPPQTQIIAKPFAPSSLNVPCPLDGCSVLLWGTNVFSFTGLLCISGVVLAAGYCLVVMVFGGKIALKRFHVVPMAEGEYVDLQEKIKETAHRLGISAPKVGLTEDLVPNAFTLGCGRSVTVVFSLGILDMLEPEELEAVVSHELAHIKAKDYLFKSLTYTLTFVAFFNPLSYVASSRAQRERELLADQKGAALLGKPALMAFVLTKVEAVVQQFPAPSLADRFSASLFLVSPLAHRPSIFASHPKISQRIQNIQSVNCKPLVKHKKTAASIFLLGTILALTLLSAYSSMQIQQTYSQNENASPSQYQVLMYNATAFAQYPQVTAFYFSNLESYNDFKAGLPNGMKTPVNGTVELADGTKMSYSNIGLLDSTRAWHTIPDPPN
jgi:heat shock protein HtpX